MKFWEALKEMEAGAVGERDWNSRDDWQKLRVRDDRLEVESTHGWESADAEVCLNSDWRIVTPAPSEEKPEPHADDCKSDTFDYTRNAPYPKPDPSEDVSLRMRTAKLENDVCELSANRDALSKRVEALEDFKERHGKRLNLQSMANIRRDERLSAIEAKLAAQEDAQTNLMAPAKRSEEVVAWPKGSMQWAEVEAKALGLNKVRRRTHSNCETQRVSSFFSTNCADRHELDWEPCE